MVKANTGRGGGKSRGKNKDKNKTTKSALVKNRSDIRIKSAEETKETHFELGPANHPADVATVTIGYWALRIPSGLPGQFHNMAIVMKSEVSMN